MHISLRPEQFASLEEKLKAQPGVTVMMDGNTGTITNSQVKLSFAYDGLEALDIAILEKHGLAKWASESTIELHIREMISANV